MTDQVTLVGGPCDGMTIDDPGTGVSFTIAGPGGEIRYIILKLEPELKAYFEDSPEAVAARAKRAQR